jgi:hypothetical protein
LEVRVVNNNGKNIDLGFPLTYQHEVPVKKKRKLFRFLHTTRCSIIKRQKLEQLGQETEEDYEKVSLENNWKRPTRDPSIIIIIVAPKMTYESA